MTVSRDPDRLIRAYLDEGLTELPTHAYDAVRSEIDRTRQRVVIGPWREPAMPTLARSVVALVAVLIVGVVGLNLAGRAGPGPVGASPSPSPTTSPPSPRPAAYVWPAPLDAGTYETTFVWDVPFTTRFTAPDGWLARDVELLKDPDVGIQFTYVDNVYADPCARTPLDPPIGPNVSDLVEGLKSITGATVTHGEPVTFGGAPGRYVELDLPVAPACSLETLSLWHEQADKAIPGKPYGGPDEVAVVRHHRLWILDVGIGKPYVIDASSSDESKPTDLAEQQAIVESIRIGQPTTTADCTVSLIDYATRSNLTGPPYEAKFFASTSDMRGPVPDPLPSFAQPFARVDFAIDGGPDWGKSEYASDRPGTNVTGPDSSKDQGWSTNMTVGGFQGSMILDATGTWLLELGGVNPACPHTFAVNVLER